MPYRQRVLSSVHSIVRDKALLTLSVISSSRDRSRADTLNTHSNTHFLQNVNVRFISLGSPFACDTSLSLSLSFFFACDTDQMHIIKYVAPLLSFSVYIYRLISLSLSLFDSLYCCCCCCFFLLRAVVFSLTLFLSLVSFVSLAYLVVQ